MKKKLVVLTGAGMSVESGLSTFRDSGGLWDRYPVEDVATPEGWERNPALVQEFYNKRRKELLTVEPNKGHFGLAALEKDYDWRFCKGLRCNSHHSKCRQSTRTRREYSRNSSARRTHQSTLDKK